MVVSLIFSVIYSHVPYQYPKSFEKHYESEIHIGDSFRHGEEIALVKLGDTQT
jgi:hypothetical protein